MQGISLPSMWPHAAALNTISSSLAAEIESNTCPICFELMKSPDFSPMLLSPCGHTFCAKCVARHTSVHQKNARAGGQVAGQPPCPYCRQKISSQTLNISLQKIITNILSLHQKLEKVEVDKNEFCDGFLQAQTRSQILQNELQISNRTKQEVQQALMEKLGFSKMCTPIDLQCKQLYGAFLETSVSKQRLEGEIAHTDDFLEHLQAKQEDIKERLQMVSLENQKVTKDLMDTGNKRAVLKRAHEDLTAKMSLIEASLSALEQERHKYRLLSQDQDWIEDVQLS